MNNYAGGHDYSSEDIRRLARYFELLHMTYKQLEAVGKISKAGEAIL